MTITNKDKYRDAAWDWGILMDCFGDGNIRPSDIDGIVEKNHHFLFIEAKPRDKEIATGQAILFQHLARLPRVTVLILWGNVDDPTVMETVGLARPQSCSLEDVRHFCGVWYSHARACRMADCERP